MAKDFATMMDPAIVPHLGWDLTVLNVYQAIMDQIVLLVHAVFVLNVMLIYEQIATIH